jgi:outer membrane lipoprotein SlyB
MRIRTKKIAIGIAALVALALGGAALAGATGGSDQGLSGGTAQKASTAALKAVGGGEVTATELDNEKGATYEVEVKKTDGSTVDVRLDESFGVVAIDGDSESGDSNDAGE